MQPALLASGTAFDVDPSQNITVSCRRSASRGACFCFAGSAVAAFTRWPHPPQNWSPGSLMNPQLLHVIDSAAPHLEQNRRPSRFSAPQPRHVMVRGRCRRSECRSCPSLHHERRVYSIREVSAPSRIDIYMRNTQAAAAAENCTLGRIAPAMNSAVSWRPRIEREFEGRSVGNPIAQSRILALRRPRRYVGAVQKALISTPQPTVESSNCGRWRRRGRVRQLVGRAQRRGCRPGGD
jgi:hypothetical protein